MNQRSRLIFYAILIFAVILRFWAIDSQSLWLDELWAIEIANGHGSAHQLMPVDQIVNYPPNLTGADAALPVWRIWTGMDRFTHPPGSAILLRLWMMIFGYSETSVRSLSALFSILALAVILGAVRSLASTEAATWATAIACVAGTQIRYAQDCRSYTLLLFESAVSAMLVIRISTKRCGIGSSIGLGFSFLCLLLTHYFSIAVVFALSVFSLFCTMAKARRKILLSAMAALLVFAIIWGPFMWRQIPMFSTEDPGVAFLKEKFPDHIHQTLWRLITMPMSMICDLRPIPHWYAIAVLWYVLAVYILYRRRLNWIWPILYFMTVGLCLTLDLAHSTEHLAFIRYAYPATLAVYAVLGASISLYPVVGRSICAGIILFCAYSLPSTYAQTNEDFRSFCAAINASTQKGDLIVFAGPAYTYAPQIQYLAASYYSWPLPGPVVLIESPAKPDLMAQLKSRKTIWMAADPTILIAHAWLPGYHIVAGKSWPEVGSFLEMQQDPQQVPQHDQ